VETSDLPEQHVWILGERARCERKRKRDEGDNEPGEYLTAVSEEPFTIQFCFREFVMICGAAVEIKYECGYSVVLSFSLFERQRRWLNAD
jgi:hypothetical protein